MNDIIRLRRLKDLKERYSNAAALVYNSAAPTFAARRQLELAQRCALSYADINTAVVAGRVDSEKPHDTDGRVLAVVQGKISDLEKTIKK